MRLKIFQVLFTRNSPDTNTISTQVYIYICVCVCVCVCTVEEKETKKTREEGISYNCSTHVITDQHMCNN